MKTTPANLRFAIYDLRNPGQRGDVQGDIQHPMKRDTAPWDGDWRLGIAEERVAMAEERLALAGQRMRDVIG